MTPDSDLPTPAIDPVTPRSEDAAPGPTLMQDTCAAEESSPTDTTTDDRPTPSIDPAEGKEGGPLREEDLTDLARRRVIRTRGVWLAAVTTGAVLLAGLAGYDTGRAQWSPPATVTTVSGATATFPVSSVYAHAKASIVQVLVKNGGTGTGFFYGPDRIVTNAHVVQSSPEAAANAAQDNGKGEKVTLRLADGRVKTGTVVAYDNQVDVAVIAVAPGLGIKPLPFAKDAVHAKVGEPVTVAGFPFGGPLTISTGILSGVVANSQFAESAVQSALLQTDAAVNPGNSGGPMLDATGAVLGMVTLRPDTVDQRPTSGLAFALPADQVRQTVTELEKTGTIRPPIIGVQLATADFDKDGGRGALVKAVTAGSPAATAGVRVGDRITSFNGHQVRTADDVIKDLVGQEAGDRATLVDHAAAHTTRRVTLTLGER